MANNWSIPSWLESRIRKRDKTCVYCRVKFTRPKGPRKTTASWEHIINDASIITEKNIALCCCSCNSSKGARNLSDWLLSRYCTERKITPETVAAVVKEAIENGA